MLNVLTFVAIGTNMVGFIFLICGIICRSRILIIIALCIFVEGLIVSIVNIAQLAASS